VPDPVYRLLLFNGEVQTALRPPPLGRESEELLHYDKVAALEEKLPSRGTNNTD